MIASDDDGRLDRAFFYKIIDCEAEPRALAIAEPADAGGQSLKLNALASEFNPSAQAAVLGEKLQHKIVGNSDIGSLARKRGPAKWASAFAKKRPNIGRNKSRKVVSIFHAALKREGTNIIAIVERNRAHCLQAQHAFDVLCHRIERALLIRLWIAQAQFERGFKRHAVWHIAI